MISPVTASSLNAGLCQKASAQPTPFAVDAQNYGEVGAAVLGGARALGEAAEATYDATLGRLVDGVAAGVGPVVDGIGSAASEAGDGIAAISDKIAAVAVDAYEGVAALAGKTAEASEAAYDAVADAASAVADGVGEVVDDITGYALLGVAAIVD